MSADNADTATDTMDKVRMGLYKLVFHYADVAQWTEEQKETLLDSYDIICRKIHGMER